MKNIVCIFLCLYNFCLVYSQSINLEEYLPENFVKDGSVDYTTYLQKGLDENQIVEFPNFPILINKKGLQVRSDQKLNFSEGACLIMQPNAEERYGLLNLKNIQNVVINNPVLKGDKYEHKGKIGEWGMGINILSSSNVEIINPVISECWGDGIYIGEIVYKERKEYNLKDYFCRNIKISGGVIDDNRRNGVSVISVKGLSMENILVQNTKGTMPMAGICIEPNNNEQFLENIVLRNIISKNNAEVGIKYVVSSFLGKRNKNVYIRIENFKDYGSKVGLYLGGARNTHGKETKKIDGNIKIKTLNLFDNEESIRFGSIQKFNPKISISSFKIFKDSKQLKKEEYLIISELNKKGINVSN